MLLREYQPFESFEKAINIISNDHLTGKKLPGTEDEITNFIGRYDKVAPAEVASVFELSDRELESSIKSLEQQKRVRIVPAGNGYFISIRSEERQSDPS
jgi:hypothetical protein